MEADQQLAPSVVAVMVVHEPGDWFDETLRSLAAQDYSNLRTLFLLTPTGDEGAELSARIRDVIPSAFVRQAPSAASFGAAVNEVLRLVEGDNGFFLVCHDDIALAPNAVRVLVAELFRSNAGIVGPKLVDWDDPSVLQHVGVGLDRFGELEEFVEPGEVDQEQHDAVRDVFFVPAACCLVRADLFRSLGGFDAGITFYGDDAELCWRAHHTGARVIVAPDAVVRHRERLSERRPDLAHQRLRSRHRMRTVAALTGGSRLFGRSVQMVVLTVAELVVGVFTGRLGEALSSLRALVGLIPRTGGLIARRRAIAGQRAVPEREVLGLQNRGSSRLTSYLRGRETATFVGEDTTVRRWRQASFGPLLAWFFVIAAAIIGSRGWISGSVPAVGELLRFPSAGSLWDSYRSSLDSRGFGATTTAPTGWAAVSIASVVTWFRMPMFMTLVVVGSYLIGALGAWRLATVFPINRARVAGMVVYAGTPLVPGIYQSGDLSALVVFAALPWLLHETRLAAGLATADPEASAVDLHDGVAAIDLRQRAKSVAVATLVAAVAASVVPVVLAVWLAVGLLVAVGTLVALASWRVAAWLAGCTVMSVAAAWLLNLPWALTWTWSDLVGEAPAGATGRSLVQIASLSPTNATMTVLAVGLYLPLVAGVAISRAWRLSWAVRAVALVLPFLAAMVLSERGELPFAVPRTAILSVPVALGLALGAAAMAGAFGADVLGRDFGWRQPLALLANGALVLGIAPAVLAIGNGHWRVERNPLATIAEGQFQANPTLGDYRVLYIGDPRVLPVPGTRYADGIAYAVVDSGPLDFTDRFPTVTTAADEAVVRALGLMQTGSVVRAGRLLAPLGIRFVAVPLTDGAKSTIRQPIAAPVGLLDSFRSQLDLSPFQGLPSLEIFLNRSWVPAGAQLFAQTAEASTLAGDDVLVRADLTEAVASMSGIDHGATTNYQVAPGVVHVAVPFDSRWALETEGGVVEPRPSFGVGTAFDVAADGVGKVVYRDDGGRGLVLAGQLLAWLAVLVVATGASVPFARRRRGFVVDETLIHLGSPPRDGLDSGVGGGVAFEHEFDEFDHMDHVDAPADSSWADAWDDTDAELATGTGTGTGPGTGPVADAADWSGDWIVDSPTDDEQEPS